MLCLFYVISLVTFFAPWIGNDGYYYYAFTRSVVIDGDIQLANEFRFNPNHYDVPHVHGLPSPTARTDDGYAPSGAPVGTSLLWIPFFLLAHGIAFVANMLGFPISMNGYSLPYLALVGWGSTLYAFLALTLTYLICRDYFSKAASLLAVLALWFGSSLFDYMYLETTMSHSADLFVAALFLYVYCRTERVWGIGRWTLLGLLGGLLAITRFQNVVYLVVPGLLLIRELAIGLSRARWDKAGEAALKSATFALYFAIPWILETILFRALVTKDMVGRLLGPEGMFAVSVSQVVEALFSMRDGLFTITPIVAFAVMGVAFFYRKDRALFFFLAVPALLQLLIASSFTYRFWGPHFGMRYLINPIPLFILGLAALLDKRWIPLKVAAIPI
ncbi:MAG: hypothetical protein Q8P59_14125, partial [Dehalococcoidia bacterium]|nr:hypothetical protein [Dehalococcoidia bacterium]